MPPLGAGRWLGTALVAVLQRGAWLFMPQLVGTSLWSSGADTSSYQTLAGQHKGTETKLLYCVPLVPKDPACPLGCSSAGTCAACESQPRQDKGTGMGHRAGRWGKTGQKRQRGLEEDGGVLVRHTSSSAGSGTTGTASLRRPLHSCPQPGTGSRVMGYLGVGLLSLPL